ncbi:MAG TPA: TonB family protein [Verrucomicrobiae bacterium]
MRKVYHHEKTSLAMPMALAAALIATAGVFLLIPFTHLAHNPKRTLELRKASVADVPPPVEDTFIPPPVEPESSEEDVPEPQLAEAPQQIPLNADLDIVVGSGGALTGFGEVRALTAVESVQQEAFDVGDLEKRPEPIAQVPPTYPAELRKAKVEGVVTVLFVLNEEGRVESPKVETSTRPEFEKPALEAIRKWRFRPGEKDGQPVRTFIRIPMRFRVTSG